MAWYALYKWFSKFRKKPYVNQVYAYRQYLFDKWFDELTDEQRVRYLKNRVKKKLNFILKRRVNKCLEKNALIVVECYI